MIEYSETRRPTVPEYVDFLSRTDLGAEYPRKDFLVRLERLIENADLCVTAWDEGGRLVGACMGLTNFAFDLYLTDLGVDRDLLRQGIGRELLRRTHELAGGTADIGGMTWAGPDALAFYADSGWKPHPTLVARGASDWKHFTVKDPKAVLRGEF